MDKVRTSDEWYEVGDPITEAEAEWLLLGPWAGGVPGLVRRVRRILDVSQRGLAALLEVSQSRVARWETARTSPPMNMMLVMLRHAGLLLQVHDEAGERVEPMRDDGARDVRGRRHPAHVDLTASTWWTPRGSSTSSSHLAALRRSRALRRPQIRYLVCPVDRRLQRLALGTPVDHPSDRQLAVEVEWHDEARADRRRPWQRRLEQLRGRWREQDDRPA
jgi:transcriptional regulator with XRE-family HTH domain